eukprot:3282428-Pleurochrysis_carterae.AAC.3
MYSVIPCTHTQRPNRDASTLCGSLCAQGRGSEDTIALRPARALFGSALALSPMVVFERQELPCWHKIETS